MALVDTKTPRSSTFCSFFFTTTKTYIHKSSYSFCTSIPSSLDITYISTWHCWTIHTTARPGIEVSGPVSKRQAPVEVTEIATRKYHPTSHIPLLPFSYPSPIILSVLLSSLVLPYHPPSLSLPSTSHLPNLSHTSHTSCAASFPPFHPSIPSISSVDCTRLICLCTSSSLHSLSQYIVRRSIWFCKEHHPPKSMALIAPALFGYAEMLWSFHCLIMLSDVQSGEEVTSLTWIWAVDCTRLVCLCRYVVEFSLSRHIVRRSKCFGKARPLLDIVCRLHPPYVSRRLAFIVSSHFQTFTLCKARTAFT